MRKVVRNTPLVFVHVSDPVGSGFVASFASPGGNVTGFTDIEASLGSKWLQLLKELAPQVARAALLFNPETAPGGGSFFLEPFLAAGPPLGIAATPAPVRSLRDIETTLTALSSVAGGGFVTVPESFIGSHSGDIIELAARLRLPAVYSYRYQAARGGLLSYGIDSADLYRRAAVYVDRILSGMRPADLPVQQPTKFELILNLKTAASVGLSVPPALLARADEVIE